jgi:twinkle protein
MDDREDSTFISHIPCDSCGSRDAGSLYSDGHTHCFSCGYHTNPTEGHDSSPIKSQRGYAGMVESYQFESSRRSISVETFNKFRYHQATVKEKTSEKGKTYLVNDDDGDRVHVANYIVDGEVVAQKVRFADKRFRLLGDTKNLPLFGQWLWKDGGKRITITEGEIDCMSVSQVQDNKWAVVSVPNGAQAAKKDLSKHLTWLERFDEIVICFDNDEPGNKAAKECAQLFTPGKAKIARLPKKDANEMLKAGLIKELINALWDAKSDRPIGVYSGTDVVESGEFEVTWGDTFPFESMSNWTYGMRPNEMYAYGAGTGVGKTDLLKRIIGHVIKTYRKKVGTLLLEEPNLMLTVETIAGQIDGQFYHIPGFTFDNSKHEATKSLVSKHLEMYRADGPLDTEYVCSIIRYMVVALGCTHIVLDHVTYILDGEEGENQNSAMKKLMRSLNDLNKELPFVLHYVSHLRKSKQGGKTHEEGGRVTLDDFVGGKAVTQYANFVFAIERDQQSDTEDDRDLSVIRCLKDRYTGFATGKTQLFRYDRTTGLKHEVDREEDSTAKVEGSDFF